MDNTGVSREGLDLVIGRIQKFNQTRKLAASNDMEQDIMMNPQFTDFIAGLDMGGLTEVFDYPAWLEEQGIDLFDEGWIKNSANKLNLEDTRKLLTAAVRLERFSPGLLNKLYGEGYFRTLESCLVEFRDKMK